MLLEVLFQTDLNLIKTGGILKLTSIKTCVIWKKCTNQLELIEKKCNLSCLKSHKRTENKKKKHFNKSYNRIIKRLSFVRPFHVNLTVKLKTNHLRSMIVFFCFSQISFRSHLRRSFKNDLMNLKFHRLIVCFVDA